jgi:hypothetical protein
MDLTPTQSLVEPLRLLNGEAFSGLSTGRRANRGCFTDRPHLGVAGFGFASSSRSAMRPYGDMVSFDAILSCSYPFRNPFLVTKRKTRRFAEKLTCQISFVTSADSVSGRP